MWKDTSNKLEAIIKVVWPEETGSRAYQIFTDAQVEQLNRLIKYADYYDNKAFDYITADYPEYSHSANNQYRPSQIPINYSRYIVDKLASWQFEQGINISVTSDKKTLEKKATDTETELYELNLKNNMDLKLLQAAKEANTSGGVVFKMIYDDGVRFLVRPRIECFPIPEFDDYEKINKVHFVAFRSEDVVWKQTYELAGGICYFEEATYNVKEGLRIEEVIQERTPLGKGKKYLDFIPVYIIPNNPTAGMVWGYSELEDLIPIIDEINKKYSDSADALRFEMFAITVLMNTKKFSKPGQEGSVETKPGAVWNLMGMGGIKGTSDANIKSEVFKLESGFNYRETLQTHLDNLKNAMFELASVTRVSPESVAKLGNLSGVALKLLFASMVSKIDNKNTIWKPKLEQMFTDSLKMRSVYESYAYPEDLKVEVIIQNPTPMNEAEEVEIATQKLAAGLTSIKREMNNMGVENAEELMAEILAERQEQDKAYNDTYGVERDQD